MTRIFAKLAAVFLLAGLFPGGMAEGQVVLHLRTNKRDYIGHEAVEVQLTISNRAGRDLVLSNDVPGGWLDFNVVNERGRSLSPRRGGAVFRPLKIRAGQSVKKVIRLSEIYPVGDYGRYRVTARVRLPGGGRESFHSNAVPFMVGSASKVYVQRVGTKDGRQLEYQVLKGLVGEKTEVFVRVNEARSGRALRVTKLGEALFFIRPKATVSGKSHLHLLYLQTPTIFTHVEVSPSGSVVKREHFKRAAAGDPRLVTFGNGEVKVAGAVPFEARGRGQQRAGRRKISDRPDVLYR